MSGSHTRKPMSERSLQISGVQPPSESMISRDRAATPARRHMVRTYARPRPFRYAGISLLSRRALAVDGARDVHARVDAELAQDAADVAFDGLLAQVQPGGDLAVAQAVGDQFGDLALARGEGREQVAAG